jgi:hypothetical protein
MVRMLPETQSSTPGSGFLWIRHTHAARSLPGGTDGIRIVVIVVGSAATEVLGGTEDGGHPMSDYSLGVDFLKKRQSQLGKLTIFLPTLSVPTASGSS